MAKFFTLYFIPLGNKGEYVECGCCKGTFITRMLNSSGPTKNEFMANYEKAIRHSMVLMMLADGVIDDNEKEQVLEIINKFGKNDLDMAGLEVSIEMVKLDNEDISTYLEKVGPSLNEHGKEAIIKCALSVAVADGNIDDSELDLISKMGEAMEMSSSHIKGILAEQFEA